MIKAIIGLIVAGMIAGGIYYFAVYDSEADQAEQTGEQIQDSLDAIDGANDAIQQQTDRADQIQQQAEQQENLYGN